MLTTRKASLALILFSLGAMNGAANATSNWILVDNFEQAEPLSKWLVVDAQNETNPFVPKPQVAEIIQQSHKNHYYLKKPAPNGIVGNRKALSYLELPAPVPVGETYTFYTRINVESFPNNHSFGLSNLNAQQIDAQNYNAFEPMLRVTDKSESNGYQNSGALTVIGGHKNNKAFYHNVKNSSTGKDAQPLLENIWYQLWYVVNNDTVENGGQTYDIYIKGGEFSNQQAVYENAKFRMKRTLPLTHFITIANTGPAKAPYGNGGLRYDDIYMVKGRVITTPQ